eukprot:scaffold301_cov273-Chaetoceros_neogracile.AAC.5
MRFEGHANLLAMEMEVCLTAVESLEFGPSIIVLVLSTFISYDVSLTATLTDSERFQSTIIVNNQKQWTVITSGLPLLLSYVHTYSYTTYRNPGFLRLAPGATEGVTSGCITISHNTSKIEHAFSKAILRVPGILAQAVGGEKDHASSKSYKPSLQAMKFKRDSFRRLALNQDPYSFIRIEDSLGFVVEMNTWIYRFVSDRIVFDNPGVVINALFT